MKLRSYRQSNCRGKTVLYRATYDITLKQRGATWTVPDDTRIRETLPTVRWLLKQRAKIVILSWLGRPKRAGEPAFRMDPVAKRLSFLIKKPVQKLADCVGPAVESAIAKMKPGQIVLLENVRFHSEEEKNDAVFSRRLGRLADLMITDAFGQAHRRAASIIGITKHLYAFAGPLMEREVAALSRVLENPKRPLVGIIGGAKISDKLGLISKFISYVDYLLLGGALANTLLAAHGIQIGRSLKESGLEKILKGIKITDPKLKLPIDVITASDRHGHSNRKIRPVGRVGSKEYILDVGPETVDLFGQIIQSARMVVWNGPMGYFENSSYAAGTLGIAKQMAASRAETIVGGGDSIAALHQAGLLAKMSYVSTGGGAMLEFMEKGTLPGIEPLTIH